MENTASPTYYQKVANYYDCAACDYEERYWKNIIAQRIRQGFREEVKAHDFGTALEIGCGTGLDASHFASIYPERTICAIDLAPAMVASATDKIRALGLENAQVKIGSPEDVETLFPGVKFDHIYVFFGALNTAPDLRRMAELLRGRLKPNGTMVLTFVNKWYLADMLICLLRFRFRMAFARLGKVWPGYSVTHPIESRCYSPGEIQQAFGAEFEITRRRGFSILYPAWYRVHWTIRLGRRLSEFLWAADRLLNRTPGWCLGEYALYSFRAKS